MRLTSRSPQPPVVSGRRARRSQRLLEGIADPQSHVPRPDQDCCGLSDVVAEIRRITEFASHKVDLCCSPLIRRWACCWLDCWRGCASECPGSPTFAILYGRAHLPPRTYSSRPRFWNRLLEKRVLHRAGAVLANAEGAAAQWRERYPWAASKLHVIWNGFDAEATTHAHELPPRKTK